MKSIVLLSGGLDSTVNLAEAVRAGEVLRVLTFDYGQKSALREVRSSQVISARYGLSHEVIKLPWLASITKTALVEEKADLPETDVEGLESVEESNARARAVWVPNRNALFVNIAASFAEALGAEAVVAGFNREEAQGFPDNSADFVAAANSLFHLSTLSGVKAISYTLEFTKQEIVLMGMQLGAPLEEIWFCYLGEDSPCGVCESCIRARRAFERAGYRDWFQKNFPFRGSQ